MTFDAVRRKMVDCQMLPNRITDERIIDIMLNLPREEFLPDAMKKFAYADRTLPIGSGRYLLDPLITATMLQSLELKQSDVVLSIGCGAGYAVAALAKIVNTVVAVEIDKKLAKEAVEKFAINEIDNVVVVDGELSDGYPKQAPYDVIFFDGGVGNVPDSIKGQLAEQGRAIAVVANPGCLGTLRLFKKFHGMVSDIELLEAFAPILPGFIAENLFSL